MNRNSLILVSSLVATSWCVPLLAQTGQPASTKPDVTSTEIEEPTSLDAKLDEQTGLQVEERRFDNRLDGVTVQHGDKGVKDYYNLSDPDVERRDGGIIEEGAMRTWRLGGFKN